MIQNVLYTPSCGISPVLHTDCVPHFPGNVERQKSPLIDVVCCPREDQSQRPHDCVRQGRHQSVLLTHALNCKQLYVSHHKFVSTQYLLKWRSISVILRFTKEFSP